MASIEFTDADGTWNLHNGKPFPASRFGGWTQSSVPFGDTAARLSDGALTMFRLRIDYGASLQLSNLPAQRSNNLLLRSRQLDQAAWTLGAATVLTEQVTGPDGQATADKLRETAVTDNHFALQSVSGLTTDALYLYSILVRAADRTWCKLGFSGKDGTERSAFFNLSTGAVGTTSGLNSYGSMFWGRDFYRAWIIATAGSGGSTPSVQLYIATADATTNYAGVAGNGIYATAAQLELATGRTLVQPSPGLVTAAAAVSNVSMVDVADRLIYHLLNGGTCAVNTNDAATSAYATCGLKPGTTPSLELTDRRALEYTLSLQLVNLAGSPARMSCYYVEQ